MIFKDNATPAQIVETFRGRAAKSSQRKGFQSCTLFGCGSTYSKLDAERLLHLLVEKKMLREKLSRNGMGYPITYIDLGSNTFLNGENLTLQFHEVKSPKTPKAVSRKAKSKKGGRGDTEETSLMDSSFDEHLLERLKLLRKKV